MKKNKLPNTDSIQKLAKFWQNHDLTDFAEDLEEVTEPVFSSGDSINLRLRSREAKEIRKLAESKGISQGELIREWVLQKLGQTRKSN